MTHRPRQLLALTLLPLALGGFVAGCGSDATDSADTAAPAAASASTPSSGSSTSTGNEERTDHGTSADEGSATTGGGSSSGGSTGSGGASSSSSSPSSSSASSGKQPASSDAAFVRQMIPHHELAIAMAKTAQQHGEHREIKTLAASIIQTQTLEAKTMKVLARRLGVKTTAADSEAAMAADAKTLGLDMGQMGMSMDAGKLADADPFDLAFIAEMTPHHEGAVRMASAELDHGRSPQLKRIAAKIVTGQARELAEMNRWKAAWS